MLNPNHYSQNIRLIKCCLLWKYSWKILNGCLLQWCYFFIHMLLYFALLSVFCFPKTNPNIRRFWSFLSFYLGIDYGEFIVSAFGSQSLSVGQLQLESNCNKLPAVRYFFQQFWQIKESQPDQTIICRFRIDWET